MSIKIQGQTVVDNNKNIVDANSATFTANVDARNITASRPTTNLDVFSGYGAGTLTSQINANGSATFDDYVTSKEGFYVSQTAAPSGSSLFKSWQGSNTYVDIFDNGSAEFAGNVIAKRSRSNTAGDVALSVHPSDTTVNYGFRVDGATNSFNLDRVDTSSNLLSIKSDGSAEFAGSVESENNFFVNAIADGQVCFRTIRNGVNTASINGNGSATFGAFNTSSPTTHGVTIDQYPNSHSGVRVQSTSSATAFGEFFAGYRGSNMAFQVTTGGALKAASGAFEVDDSGVIQTNINTAGIIKLNSTADFVNPKIQLSSVDGSATFAGDIKTNSWDAGGLGFRLDSGGAINLNQPGSGQSISVRQNGTETAAVFGNGNATFAGTVDAAGFTVNGAALSAAVGGGDVSTLVESTNGTTIAEAKVDSNGDRVLDLNEVVIAVDMGAMTLGRDEVNTPWQQGIYMDATSSNNNDKTRMALYGTGTNDTAFQIYDGANSKNSVWMGHDGVAQFSTEDDYTSGIAINPESTGGSLIDVYTDGSETGAAFRVYNGTDSRTMASIDHNGNAGFNLDTTNWDQGVKIFGSGQYGSNIAVYNDGTTSSSAFRVYDSADGYDKINLYHNGNAGFNLDTTNWDQGVKIFGSSQYGSGITVYRDSTISAHTGTVFRCYDKPTNTNTIRFYGNGNGFFTGFVQAENIYAEQALYAHTDGTGSIKIWKGNNSDGTSTGMGWSALDATTTGAANNTALGTGTLQHLTTGVRNTAVGTNASQGGSGGTVSHNDCVAVGYNSLNKNQTGSENIAIGAWSSYNTTVGNNISIGRSALYNNTTNNSNIAIGNYSLHNSNGGQRNTAIGDRASFSITQADDCTSLGYQALYSIPGEGGSRATAIGTYAMYNSTGGYENTAVGYTALYNNNYSQSSAFGAFAGRYDTSGNDSASFYDTTCIGYNSRASGHYQVVLGDTNAYTYTNGGSVYSLSDARDKTDVRDTIMGLDFIKSLRPVDYRWDYREDYLQFDPDTGNHNPIPKDGSKKRTRFHHGLIAQEVKSAADGLGVDFAGFQDHTINGGEERMTLGYSEFIAPLIKAVQELSEENAALKARLDAAGL